MKGSNKLASEAGGRARPRFTAYALTMGNPIFRLFAAMVVAIVALYLCDRQKIRGDQFALQAGSYSMADSWRGQIITAWEPRAIDDLVNQFSERLASQPSSTNKNVLWLGFSQLHVINQYKSGDHLAPYWLIKDANCDECINPLAISLPNANLQEYFFLTTMISEKMPLSKFSAIILTLPFDKLRNDGLRDEFDIFMNDEIRAQLRRSEIGRSILAEWDSRSKLATDDDSSGLRGFAQRQFEDRLTNVLDRMVPLWSERGDLRSRVLVDLFFMRNAVFGVKPDSLRKTIRPRYIRNMQALDALMTSMNQVHVAILAYIAPIRSDITTPYDPAEYAAWKKEVIQLCAKHEAKCLNFESLVPAQYWGTPDGESIDFMHFRNDGHEILAQALLPELKQIFDAQRR